MNKLAARVFLSLSVVAGFVIGSAGPGQAQFVLYDTFDGPLIDPEKWYGVSVEGTSTQPTTEGIRMIEGGQLRLALVAHGNDTSDSGSATSRKTLAVRQLGTLGGTGFITGMKARVTVVAAEALGCPASLDVALARAFLMGWFFNDGTGGGLPGDFTGNIIAWIRMDRDSTGTNRIKAQIERCVDAPCSGTTPVSMPGNPVTFATTWTVGTPMVLKLNWLQASHLFRFTANGTETLDIDYTGVLTDTAPPASGDFRNLRVQNTAVNCNGARKRTVMDTLFDKVFLKRNP